ncbi:unnamed protein product [Prorocentrum cordatum]|nr:unnamed protein product [Polarella glacialis]
MSSQQALADAAFFIRAAQRRLNCTRRGSPGYCPVLTIGGSYPGFLSAMMRLRYPAVVDMAYAASALVTCASTRRRSGSSSTTPESPPPPSGPSRAAPPPCGGRSRRPSSSWREPPGRSWPGASTSARRLRGASAGGTPPGSPTTCCSWRSRRSRTSMANYPPGNGTGLARACAAFAAAGRAGGRAPVDAVRDLLAGAARRSRAARAGPGRALVRDVPPGPRLDEEAPGGCLNLSQMLPAGPGATARCGDWSGCGAGSDGEVWDLQTCTFEVEQIGFNSTSQMFPSRAWTLEWLEQHCARRFGVQPQPRALVDLWGFDAENLKAQASRILFTNGLNDGWSAGGILTNLSEATGLVAINLPNGAHHSDLSHAHGEQDTPDVVAGHARAVVALPRTSRNGSGRSGRQTQRPARMLSEASLHWTRPRGCGIFSGLPRAERTRVTAYPRARAPESRPLVRGYGDIRRSPTQSDGRTFVLARDCEVTSHEPRVDSTCRFGGACMSLEFTSSAQASV